MGYSGNHVLRTVSDSQLEVVGIDGPMLIIYMHRLPLCTCLVMRKLSNFICYIKLVYSPLHYMY
ncbi:hypothetical protein HanIR_Chr17g0856241 [Helianthus annuus]|nr:hypothetical protein HanIR_Chr17g0856241 [Helianthus annuus]